MRAELADVTFRDPVAPLLANADARPLTTGEACRAELIEHLTRGVDWVRAVRDDARRGRRHVRRDRPRQGAHQPHPAHRAGCPDARHPMIPRHATGVADPASLLDQPHATE